MPASSMIGKSVSPNWRLVLAIGAPLAAGIGIYFYYRSNRNRAVGSAAGGRLVSVEDVGSGDNIESEVSLDRPETADAAKLKGNKYFKAGRYKDAVRHYDRAIQLCSSDKRDELATYYQNRAAAHDKLGDREASMTDCERALDLKPQYLKALQRRAKLHEDDSRWREALLDVTAVCLLEGFQNQHALMTADRVLRQLSKKLAEDHCSGVSDVNARVMPSRQMIDSFTHSFSCDPVMSELSCLSNGHATPGEGDATASSWCRVIQTLRDGRVDEVVTACTTFLDKHDLHWLSVDTDTDATNGHVNGDHKPSVASSDAIGGDADVGVASGDAIGADAEVDVASGVTIGGDADMGVASGDVIGGDNDVGVASGDAIGGDNDVGVASGDAIGGDNDVGVASGDAIGGDNDVGVASGDAIGGGNEVGVASGDAQVGVVSEERRQLLLALLLRGTFHLLGGSSELAYADLNAVIECRHASKQMRINALIKRGSCHLNKDPTDKGNMAMFCEDFQTAITIDENNPDIYFHRGQIMLATGKTAAARADFERILSLSTSCSSPATPGVDDRQKELTQQVPLATAQLAHIDYKTALQSSSSGSVSQQKRDAERRFEHVIKQHPDIVELRVLYAQALIEDEKFEEADQQYLAAINNDASHAAVLVNRGHLLLQWRGDLDTAADLMTRAVQLDDKCELAYESLGMIEVQRGQLRRGVDMFDRCLKLTSKLDDAARLFSLRESALAQLNVAEQMHIEVPRPEPL